MRDTFKRSVRRDFEYIVHKKSVAYYKVCSDDHPVKTSQKDNGIFFFCLVKLVDKNKYRCNQNKPSGA